MKRIIAFVSALVVALGGINYSGVTSVDVKAADEWKLLWSDEFDGTSLNRDNWNVEVNGNGGGNDELQYYCDDEKNIKVSDGTLKITALKEEYKGKQYTSGRMTTKGKQEFKYGKIEAKIKLPQFSGAWPAFWTLGADHSSVGWPKCGEIDIMEAINTENNTHGAVHWHVESAGYTGQGDNSSSNAGKTPEGYERTQWHTYGIIWNEDRIQWYVDDKIFMTQGITSSHMSEFRAEHFLILNLAIGGRWPGYVIDDTAFPDKSVMEVDYVRVYEAVEVPTTTVEETTATEVGNTKVKSATKKAAKVVKLSLKKLDDVTGYNVQISTTKKFKKKKTVTKTVKKVKINIKNKKFKNAKKLFVKVRAFKEVDGLKVYGEWSNIKKVKM